MKVAIVCPYRDTAYEVMDILMKDVDTSVDRKRSGYTHAVYKNGDEIIWVVDEEHAKGHKFDMAFVQNGDYLNRFWVKQVLSEIADRCTGDTVCFDTVDELRDMMEG